MIVQTIRSLLFYAFFYVQTVPLAIIVGSAVPMSFPWANARGRYPSTHAVGLHRNAGQALAHHADLGHEVGPVGGVGVVVFGVVEPCDELVFGAGDGLPALSADRSF